jgi:adenosylhomocysteine nucleosidase
MKERPVLVLTALALEARAIRRRLTNARAAIEVRVVGPQARRLLTMGEPACRAIVMAGLAGALDPRLRAGDVIVEAAGSAIGAAGRAGRIHTTARLLATAAEKAGLRASTGADVVDMENAHASSLARELGVPFLGIRAVCDAADQEIDPAFFGMVDENGNVRAGAVAAAVLRRPLLLLRMRRIQACARVALASLSRTAAAILIERGWPDGE